MKKLLAIVLLCTPFTAIICDGEAGVAKINVMATCKEGETTQVVAKSRGKVGTLNVACGQQGYLTIN